MAKVALTFGCDKQSKSLKRCLLYVYIPQCITNSAQIYPNLSKNNFIFFKIEKNELIGWIGLAIDNNVRFDIFEISFSSTQYTIFNSKKVYRSTETKTKD